MQKAIKVAIEQIKGWHAMKQTGRQTDRQSLIISLILATMIIFELGSILTVGSLSGRILLVGSLIYYSAQFT